MPLTEGNSRLVYAALQAAKGTPAATPTHRFMASGESGLNPDRVIIQLPETDGSAQRTDNSVVGADPKGAWTGWARGSEFAFLARAIMGANADAGTTPNFTHTATPSKALPYLTIWDVIPGRQTTRFDDVRLSRLTIGSEALQGCAYSVEAMALKATLGVAEPTVPAASATDVKYSHDYLTVTVGGSAPGTHDAWSLDIQRNVTVLRGDKGLDSFDSVPGQFAVDGTFRRIYESDADYRKLHGGAAAATALTRTVFSESLDVLLQETADRSIRFTSSLVEYTSITVPVNVDGSPILETLAFTTRRQATWANNLTIVTKNTLATTETSPA